DAEVALVAWCLHKLARAAPNDRSTTAELLAVRIANEVVLDARPEVVSALNARHDPAEEDVVDVVRRVESERRDGSIAQARLQTVRSGREAFDVRVTACPPVAELDAELVFDRAEFGLRSEAPHAELHGIADLRARRGVLDRAPDRRELGLD